MNLLKQYSKYLPEVLLILLFVLVLMVFRSFHNSLIASGINSTPKWAIFFLFLIAICGVLFYIIILNTNHKSFDLANTVETLKKRVEENKIQKEIKKETIVVEKIDVEKETKSMIPSNIDDLEKFGEVLLLNIARRFYAVQGLFYLKDPTSGIYSFKSGYAYYSETEPITYQEGETLAGQVAKNKKVLNLNKVPDNYIAVMSGMGDGSPSNLLIVPIISSNNETIGILEIASFKSFSSEVEELFAYLGHKLGEKIVQSTKP